MPLTGKLDFKEFAKHEDGNVLMLVLLAVVLFGALTYAITSSTSNSSKSSNETILISSTQVIQFPTNVGFGISRMLSSGASIEEIRFNRPKEFDELDYPEIGIFHPEGGGVSYQSVPEDIMVDGNKGDWYFNAELEIPYVGITGSGGNDIIAYLPGIKKSICMKINEEHGMGNSIPKLNADRSSEYTQRMYDDGTSDYDIPSGDLPDIDDGAGTFDGRPFGCFENADGTFVYYHVVIER